VEHTYGTNAQRDAEAVKKIMSEPLTVCSAERNLDRCAQRVGRPATAQMGVDDPIQRRDSMGGTHGPEQVLTPRLHVRCYVLRCNQRNVVISANNHARLLALAVSVLLGGNAAAGSTSGGEQINFGEHFSGNWRQEGWQGSSYREWSGDVDYWKFDWRTDAVDQIGSLQKGRRDDGGISAGFPLKVDRLKSETRMSTTGSVSGLLSNDYIFGVYGWTNDENEPWPVDGYRNEFYINFYGYADYSDATSLGSLTIDGVVYDCYKKRLSQNLNYAVWQWVASSRTRTWSPSVNITPIFEKWRANGLPNQYIMSLSWIVETFAGSGGSLTLSQINIPNLALPNFIDNGVYRLTPKIAPDKSADVVGASAADGAKLQIYTWGGSDNQQYTISHVGDDLYEITPQHAAGERLDVAGASTANGAKVQIWGDSNGSNQRWKIEDMGDGYYRLSPQHAPKKYLYVAGSSTVNGARIKIWEGHRGDAQLWKLQRQ
jgi:hypothetical protein